MVSKYCTSAICVCVCAWVGGGRGGVENVRLQGKDKTNVGMDLKSHLNTLQKDSYDFKCRKDYTILFIQDNKVKIKI